MNQLWHPSETFFNQFSMRAYDENDMELIPAFSLGWYAESYGQKTESQQITFSSERPYMKTVIGVL
jgi:hypothetical protein